MSDDDDEVGYKKPPKSGQIKKGERRNPNGRRGKKSPKPPQDTSMRALLEMVENELVEFQGRMITKREAAIRVMMAKAMQGDFRSMKMIEDIREKLGMNQEKGRTGVLLVPVVGSIADWEADVAAQQAPYRSSNIDDYPDPLGPRKDKS